MCRLCSPATPAARCPTFGQVFRSPAGETSSGAQAAAAAHDQRHRRLHPAASGQDGTRILIKGGVVMSVDPDVGNFAKGDVLIEGSKIMEVGHHIEAADAHVIDASGKIVMPGFIDTHHHQFETGLRSTLSDAIVVNDGRPENERNYYEKMLLGFSQHYRPRMSISTSSTAASRSWMRA
jgi:5-methylthioadenosine/S-adenosylhomocysteine deaminase